MKICPKCGKQNAFYKNAKRSDGLAVWCAECSKIYYAENRNKLLAQKRRHYLENAEEYSNRNSAQYVKNYVARLLAAAKRRAKKRNVPFSLGVSDIVIPDICPVLGIKLAPSPKSSSFNSPSLDRIIPSLGYIPGNVIVVSLKANQIKNCSTIEELEAVFCFYRKLIK